MATSHHDAEPGNASPFVRAVRRCVSLLRTPSSNDVDQALVTSCPPNAKSATLTDVYDTSSPPSPAASSSDSDWNDLASHSVPKFNTVQLKAAFIWLYQLVTALVVQVTIIASDVVSLKDRVTAVEGTQAPALIHGQETEALSRQVNALREHVASQEDRIASLERSQSAETESYKRTIQELTIQLDEMRVCQKTCDDAFEKHCQSFKNFQLSMECQGARITAVKADTSRKIALLQSGLAGVQTEVAAVKMVVVPAEVMSASQAAKEARRARILASLTQRIEDSEMAEEIEKLCSLAPVVAQSSIRATVSQDTPAASMSLGGSSIMLPAFGKTKETKVKEREITKEPLSIACTNVTQPRADKIPAKPTIPIPMIPVERLIPAKSNGKENKARISSTTTLQYTKTLQPGAGQSPDVSDKAPTASRKKAQPGAGSSLGVSVPPQPHKSMLPALRKSQLPSLAKRANAANGNSPNDVKTTYRPPGGSETRTKQPKIVKGAPIATSASRPPSESSRSTLVEKEASTVLPASSSLALLDAALQVMRPDEDDDLLGPMPALNCSKDDLSFSAISPVPLPTGTRNRRNYKRESIYVPSKQRNADVKPPRSPLKSTPKNGILSSASSSLAGLDEASQMSEDEDDILTLLRRPNGSRVDFNFSVLPPIFLGARLPFERESIYVSPIRKTSTVKPSRRL